MIQTIELHDVTKSHGSNRSLSSVSHTFEGGRVHGLVGPNAAGKTTLLRIVLGLTEPDTGRVDRPDGTVGCSFQTPTFYHDLTVRENLDLFAELGDGSRSWRETLLQRCGLDRVAHRRGGDLSAGFRKRLDVAIALIDRPDVLVLDEPLADIDDEYRSRLLALFEDYAGSNRLLLVATHHPDRFEPLLDTVTVLRGGEIRFSGDLAAAKGVGNGDLEALSHDSGGRSGHSEE